MVDFPSYYFLDPEPSSRLREVILTNVDQVEDELSGRGGSRGCQGAAQVWASVLRNNGFDGEVHDGEYYPWDPEEDPDSFGEGHTWLMVFDDSGEVLFDPTAGQFDPQQVGPRTRDRYSEYPDVYEFDEVYCNVGDDDDDWDEY